MVGKLGIAVFTGMALFVSGDKNWRAASKRESTRDILREPYLIKNHRYADIYILRYLFV